MTESPHPVSRTLMLLTVIAGAGSPALAGQTGQRYVIGDLFPPPSVVRVVEGSAGTWTLEKNLAFEREDGARMAPHLGRPALWLRSGVHVLLSGVEFSDGTIEFDFSPMQNIDNSFAGVVFRRHSLGYHENIYLRPHNTGRFDAVQYAPRMHGATTFQLYDFYAQTEIHEGRWTHLRLEVRGPRLEVYIDRADEPALVVPQLRGLTETGGVAFWARIGEEGERWAAAVSNVEVRPLPPTAGDPSPPTAPPPGTLTDWRIAGPTDAAAGPVRRLPSTLADAAWQDLPMDVDGLANLTALYGQRPRRRTVFARTALRAEAASLVALDIAYSDEITVFLNGRPLYSAVGGFGSRNPRFVGLLSPGSEFVYLPLRPGENELVLAVTDRSFGWGFRARLAAEDTGQN